MGVYSPITAAQAHQRLQYLASAETLLQSVTRSRDGQILHFEAGRSSGTAFKLHAFGDLIYGQSRQTAACSSLNGATPLPPYVATPYINYATHFQLPTSAPNPVPTSLRRRERPRRDLRPPAPTNPFLRRPTSNSGFAPNDQSAGNIVTVHNRFLDFPRVTFSPRSTRTRTTWSGGPRGAGSTRTISWELAAADLEPVRPDLHQPRPDRHRPFQRGPRGSGAINPFASAQAAGALPGNVVGSATLAGRSTLNSVLTSSLRGTP